MSRTRINRIIEVEADSEYSKYKCIYSMREIPSSCGKQNSLQAASQTREHIPSNIDRARNPANPFFAVTQR